MRLSDLATGTVERALAARFDVRGYPSIFHVSPNREVRKFDGRRSLDAVVAYIEGGWRDQAKLSLLASPFGPVGRAKGFFIWVGSFASEFHEALQVRGFSAFSAGSIMVAVGAGLVSVVVMGLASLDL